MSLDPHLRAATVAVVNNLSDHGVALDAYAAFVVMDALEGFVATADSKHDSLVQQALNDHKVMTEVREDKKIQAIKELRALTRCGLKEAKEAIEDNRVWGTYAGRPIEGWWSNPQDEPPF